MGGGSLDNYDGNMGMESNSLPTSTQCGGDHSIIGQLMQLGLSEEPLSDINSTSLDLSSGHANGGGNWQEEVYQRIETLKETYLPELNQLYQKIVTKLQQLDSLPQQPKSDQLDNKLKSFKTILELMISFLQVSKSNILTTDKSQRAISGYLDFFEKQILHLQSQVSQIIATETELQNPLASNFVGDSNKLPESEAQSGHSSGGDGKTLQNVNIDWRGQMQADSRQRIVNKIGDTLKRHLPFSDQEGLQRIATGYEESFYSAALSQSDYMRTISLMMLTIERYSFPKPLPYPLASNSAWNNNIFPYPRASPYSAAASLRLSNGGDWKEEVYQKIKTMRETSLPELSQMLQEIVTKLQQPMSDQVAKLKKFKSLLERLVSILQLSKTNILPSHKQWLGVYEWQTIHFLAIRPDPLANSQVLELFNRSSANRSTEQQLVQEVKKQKAEIEELKRTLVQMQQQVQQQQVKEEKE